MKKLVIGMTCIAMSMIFSVGAGAAEWNFYGSARVSTYYTKVDNPTSADTQNYSQELNPDSRIGASVKVSDSVSGKFEYGAGVNVRLLYGIWNFGEGKLLVGQGYSPLNLFYSNQIYTDDNNMLNYGGVYSGRNPMVQLSFGNFKIAALSPGTTSILVDGVSVSNTESKFPKIEASYQYVHENITFDVSGGINTYDIVNGGNQYDISSYIVAVGGKIQFQNGVYLNGSLWTGQNTGAYGLYNAPMDEPTITSGNVNDNNAYGALAVAGIVVNETLSFEAGYGYTQAELDTAGLNDDDLNAYYLQSTIVLAPGVYIVPEVGVIDNKQDNTGAAESEIMYYGIKWQIDF